MALLIDDAYTQDIYYDGFSASVYPLTLACWYYQTAKNYPAAVLTYVDPASSHIQELQISSDNDYVMAITRDTASAMAITTAEGTYPGWNHACGVFTNATSRAAYINGGSKGTNTTNKTPSNLSRICIGGRNNTEATKWFDGYICEVGVWETALTDDEVAALGKGVSPLVIKPASLIFYSPFYRAGGGNYIDRISGVTGTEYNGSLATADHYSKIMNPYRCRTYQVCPSIAGSPKSMSQVQIDPWLDEDWDNITDISSDDGNPASVTTNNFDTGDQTWIIRGKYTEEFSTIPDTATICGVVCRINAYYEDNGVDIDYLKLLDTSGNPAGTNLCDSGSSNQITLTTDTTAYYSRGSPTNLWGNSLTPAWIKDTDFGVAIGAKATGSNSEVFIDYVQLIVHYQPAAEIKVTTTLVATALVGKSLRLNEVCGLDKKAVTITEKAFFQAESFITKRIASILGVKFLTPGDLTTLEKQVLAFSVKDLIQNETLKLIVKAIVATGGSLVANILAVVTFSAKALSFSAKALFQNEVFKFVKYGMVATGQTLGVYIAAIFNLAKTAMAFTGKDLSLAELVKLAGQSLTLTSKLLFTNVVFSFAKVALGFTGRDTSWAEAIQLARKNITLSGKLMGVFINVLITLILQSMATAGKSIGVYVGAILGLVAVGLSLAVGTVYQSETFKLIKKATLATGQAVFSWLNVTLDLVTIALSTAGKTLWLSEIVPLALKIAMFAGKILDPAQSFIFEKRSQNIMGKSVGVYLSVILQLAKKALVGAGQGLDAAETFLMTLRSTAITGKLLDVLLVGPVTLTKTAISLAGKSVVASVSGVEQLARVVIGATGKALKITEAFILGKLAVVTGGKDIFLNITFNLVKRGVAAAGKVLDVSETFLLSKGVQLITGTGLFLNEVIKLAVKSSILSGRNAVLYLGSFVTLAKISLFTVGKNMLFNEAYKLLLYAMTIGERLWKYGLMGLGLSLDLDREDED